MASCVQNIRAKNNQNLTIGFKVTVENVGGPSFFETQCTSWFRYSIFFMLC